MSVLSFPMRHRRNTFGKVTLGLLLTVAATVFPLVASSASPARNDNGELATTTLAETTRQTGATVIDLGANPYDPSPAINHLVATIKAALAADQKVIVVLGELHDNAADVNRAELLRQGIKHAGIRERPVMVQEQIQNLLQNTQDYFFRGDRRRHIHSRRQKALAALQTADPARYRRLQAMTHAAWDWRMAPVANLENFTAWLADGEDIRLSDLARETSGLILDDSDPVTAAAINEYASGQSPERTNIDIGESEGIRLRNLFVARQLREILNESRLVIMQTGLGHLGGYLEYSAPYQESLHALFHTVAYENTLTLTVLPENRGTKFENIVPPDGQQAMNNPNTVILRGGRDERHEQDGDNSLETEIAALQTFARAANLPSPAIKDKEGYYAQLEKNRAALREEVESIIDQYAPAASSAPIDPGHK
ncbi:MAG: hypothetical protein AAB036_00195 [Elusimicrobiota bacterium]